MSAQQARKNMVDTQIRTSSVILPELLEALEVVPREVFVPDSYKNNAYNDEDIPLGAGRCILEPAVFAKMVQALEPTADDVMLYVGSGTGYGPAVLSSMISTVVVLENTHDYLIASNNHWQNLDACNIAAFEGDLSDGVSDHAPYDSIFINGAVASVPEKILNQLSDNGRLICNVKKPGNVMGEVRLYQRCAGGNFASHALFEAASPYLEGFEPKPEFNF